MSFSSVKFIKSATGLKQCPVTNLPEYAFFGRSNVGKSSLINKLTDVKGLAKTSVTPGKTQHINYFLVDEKWYIVDLPGYGYAKVAKSLRKDWDAVSKNYLVKRENLFCTFLLIDIRHKPLENDLNMINWFGENGLPFCIVFTKADKIKKQEINKSVENYKQELLKNWESLPDFFVTSSISGEGLDSLIDFIISTNEKYA